MSYSTDKKYFKKYGMVFIIPVFLKQDAKYPKDHKIHILKSDSKLLTESKVSSFKSVIPICKNELTSQLDVGYVEGVEQMNRLLSVEGKKFPIYANPDSERVIVPYCQECVLQAYFMLATMPDNNLDEAK